MTITKNLFTIILTASFLLVATLSVFAYEHDNENSMDGLTPVIQGNMPSSVTTTISTERNITAEKVEWRTENAKIYEIEEGRYSVDVYMEPIHYQTPSGLWQEIDNNLIVDRSKEAGWHNTANEMQVHFADHISPLPTRQVHDNTIPTFFTLMQDEQTIRFAPVDANEVSGQVTGNSIVYIDIYQHIDMRYFVTANTVKEELIFRQLPKKETFSYVLDIEGGQPILREDGSINIEPCHDSSCLRIASPYMEDDLGVVSEGVEVSLETLENNQYLLSYTPDKAWLSAAERAYPVVLDPTISQGSAPVTYVESRFPTTAPCGQRLISVGYDPDFDLGGWGKRETHSFVYFGMPDLPAGSTILSAGFYAWQYYIHPGGGGYDTSLHEVTSSWNEVCPSVTWNNQPTISTIHDSLFVDTSIGWKEWDITSLTQLWQSDPLTNHGFALVANPTTQRGSFFCSHTAVGSQCGANTEQHHPYMTLEYIIAEPTAPTMFPIDNADWDGDYLLEWTPMVDTIEYIVEEDDSPTFDSPTVIYTGTDTQLAITGKDVGYWYYRVRAVNIAGLSNWSSIQSIAVPNTISGHVLDANGDPLAGGNIFVNNEVYTTTDVNGYYQFPLAQAGDYTFAPAISGAVCTPDSRAISVTTNDIPNQDFSCMLGPVKVEIDSNYPTGLVGNTYIFTATTNITATTPMTYVWQIDNGSFITTVTHVSGLNDIITATWPITGRHFITITVSNEANIATDYHSITIYADDPPESYEPNNRCDDAVYQIDGQVNGGDVITSYISYAEDMDYYQLDIDSPYTIISLTLQSQSDAEVRPDVWWGPCQLEGIPHNFGSTPHNFGSTPHNFGSTPWGNGTHSTKTIVYGTGAYTGTIYILTQSISETWSSNPYTLTVETWQGEPEVDRVDLCENPTLIQSGEIVSGTIYPDSDMDCYTFTVAEMYTQIVLTMSTAIDYEIDMFSILPDGTRHYLERPYLEGESRGTKIIKYNVGKYPGTYQARVYTNDYYANNSNPYWLELDEQVVVDYSANTLVLFNRNRFTELYGENSTTLVINKLEELVDHRAVSGEIIYVDDNPNVNNAYNQWDEKSYEGANDIGYAIRNMLLSKLGSYANLKHIVIIGNDLVIPHYRIFDYTLPSLRELQYGDDIYLGSSVGSAIHAGYYLTDDFYGDFAPIDQDKRDVYIPDYGIGRLVETPDEIMNFIDGFLGQGGSAVAQNGLVVGYETRDEPEDFLIDISQAVLTQTIENGSYNYPASYIGPNWDGNILRTALTTNDFNIVLLNTHTNHGEIGTSSGIGENGRVSSSEIYNNILAAYGSAYLTPGCHSGLSLPDQSNDNEKHKGYDLPQAFLSNGVNLIGNTGYGLGGDGLVGSEQLLYLLNQNLLRGASQEIGIALRDAKHEYFTALLAGDFDYETEKALSQFILYGLPMYELYTKPDSNPMMSIDSLDTKSDRRSINSMLAIETRTYVPQLEPVEEYVGTYFQATETYLNINNYFGTGSYVQHGKPIQPLLIDHIAEDVHGVVFTSGVYTTYIDYDPIVARIGSWHQTWSGQDQDTNKIWSNEAVFDNASWHPTQLAGISRLNSWQGVQQRLMVQLGQYRETDKKERVYEQVDVALYSSASTDWTPPEILNINNTPQDETNQIVVSANDEFGIQAVVVAYTDGAGIWQSVSLASGSGNTWIGNFPASEETEFFVQVVDMAGNVTISDGDGEYYKPFLDTTPPRTFAVVCCEKPGNDEWYLDDVEIIMTAIDDLTGVAVTEYKLDDGGWTTYINPIPLTGEGRWVLQYRSTDKAGNMENTHVRYINIDKTPPTGEHSLSSVISESNGVYVADVVVSLNGQDHGDPEIASGLDAIRVRINGGAWEEYTVPFTITSNGANIVEYYVDDIAGNHSDGVEISIVVDKSEYTLMPLLEQDDKLRNAYERLFQRIDEDRYPLILNAPLTIGETIFPIGTAVFDGNETGNFTHTVVSETNVTNANILQAGDIAIFESSSDDLSASWEVLDFERLFQTYLWGDYAQIVDETDLADGLPDIKMLIIPAGMSSDVITRLETISGTQSGLNTFVQNGGWVYAQGDATAIPEWAGLVPSGTVGQGLNLTGEKLLFVDQPDLALTYNWPTNQVTVFKDSPQFIVLGDVEKVAHYAGHPGRPAILMHEVGDGGVILMGPHPTQNARSYPMVLNAILMTQGEQVRASVSVQQLYYPDVEPDIIPAFETEIPVEVSTLIENYDEEMDDFYYREIITNAFTLEYTPTADIGQITATQFITGTEIVWTAVELPPGKYTLEYQVKTAVSDTLKQGEVIISEAYVQYRENGNLVIMDRDPAMVRAEMAALVSHFTNSEPNNVYPFSAGGTFIHVREDVVNKLDTRANNQILTFTVPLIDIARDAFNQSVFSVIDGTDENIWFLNAIMGYPSRDYPLPIGAADGFWYYFLESWDCHTWVTIPNPNNQTISIPPEFVDFIKKDANGNIMVPGKTLAFELDTLLAYDTKSPAVRYRIHSQELWQRGLSVSSQPVAGTSIVEGKGFSVYTRVGQDPIPLREYLTGTTTLNPIASLLSQLTYTDIWGRHHSITESVRSDFYDVIPLGSEPDEPEAHHMRVNVTVGMEDADGHPLNDFPTYKTVTVTALIKLESVNWDLLADEFVAQYLLPTGFKYDIEYVSWSADNDTFELIDNELLDIPVFQVFNFHGNLTKDTPESIILIARLRTYDNLVSYEGDFLVSGGVNLVNQNHYPGGPNQYNLHYTNVFVEQGYQVDTTLDKKVAQSGVSIHGDTTFEVYTISEPNEPHIQTDDVYMDAVLGGDKTAQVRVGMSSGSELYFANVYPGESTLLCLELLNNTDQDWSDLLITPHPAEGITLTESFAGTEDPPNLYDAPYMWATDIPDISRGMYCWTAKTDRNLDGGVMYPVDFTVVGTGFPMAVEFPMPTALIGVKNNAGNVYRVLGEGLLAETITDTTILEAHPQTPVIVTDAQLETFKNLVNEDIDNGTNTATIYLSTITTTMSYSVTIPMSATEKIVVYDIPAAYRCLPCQDGADFASSFHFIVPVELDALENGRQPLNSGFSASYQDPFNELFTIESNGTSITAHGPEMEGSYNVISITNSFDNGWYIYLAPGEENIADVLVNVWNGGDYPAISSTITITMAEGVELLSSNPAWASRDGLQFSWVYTSILPVDAEQILLTVAVTPTTNTVNLRTPQPIGYAPIIDGSWADYVDEYVSVDVSESIGGIYQLPIGELGMAPSNLQVELIRDDTAVLTWIEVSGATGYRIYHSRVGDPDYFTDSIDATHSGTEYVGVGIDQEHRFIVVALGTGPEFGRPSNVATLYYTKDTLPNLGISLTVASANIVAGYTVNFTAILGNEGVMDATRNEFTLTLPDGFSYITDDFGCTAVTLQIINCSQNLLPSGNSQTIHVTAMVEPDILGDVTVQAEVHSLDFTDPYPSDNEQNLTLTVISPWKIFLSTIMNNVVNAPDLVVTAVSVTTNQATITIENQGNAIANIGCTTDLDCLVIDLYINPDPVPTQVNELWYENNRSSSGAVWKVTQTLAPGEQLILTLNGDYYSSRDSHMPIPLPLGAQIYVQVDSENLGVSYGFVNENHEISGDTYNNIMGPVIITED